MRLRGIILILLLIFMAASPASALKKMWDDFETPTLNTSKWLNPAGNPQPDSTLIFDGTRSLLLEQNERIVNATPFIEENGFSDIYVIQYYILTTNPEHVVANDYYSKVGFMPYVSGYPVGDEWGYDDGGYASSGIPTDSGAGDFVLDWLRVRALINKTGGAGYIYFGDGSGSLVHEFSLPTGQSEFFRVEQGSNVPAHNVSVDNIEVWDLSTHDFNGTPRFKAPPNVTIIQPQASTLYNDDPLPVYYSVFASFGETIDEVQVFINETLNRTFADTSNFTLDISDGLYSILINATDSQGFSANASVLDWVIDRTDPADNLEQVLPNTTAIIGSGYYSITATDTNLFGHNVSIYDGPVLINSSEVINIVSGQSVISQMINLSDTGNGTFYIVSNESDDHTARLIRDYDITSGENSLRFDSGHETVTIQELTAGISATAYAKLPDRYQFTFTAETAGTRARTFEITSSEKIFIRDSGYSGHLVTGELWLDFEPYPASVQRITDNTVRVALTAPQAAAFRSIGGVNHGSSIIQFTVPVPAASAIQCDLSGTFESCGNSDSSDSLQQVRATCADSLGAYFTVRNGSDTIIEGTGTNSSAVFTLNHDDFGLNYNDQYQVNVTCWNDAARITSSSNFTVQNGSAAAGSSGGAEAGESLSYNSCVFDSGSYGKILLFLFLFIVSMALLVIGKVMRHGLIGFLAGAALLIVSIYLMWCSALIAFIIACVSFLLMLYFIKRSWEGRL